MKALIKYELRLSRKILLIWMGMVLLLCGGAYFEYLSLRPMMDDLMGLVNSFPKILKVTFGVTGDLTTALGWYGCIYFWVSILDFSYAVYLGVTCMAKEKEQGTAEYLFTMPISRSQIVLAKAAACIFNLLILSAFTGLCNYVTAILPFGGAGFLPRHNPGPVFDRAGVVFSGAGSDLFGEILSGGCAGRDGVAAGVL